MNSTPPPNFETDIRAAIERLEEACATVDALEFGWGSAAVKDDKALLIVRSVRRIMIDVAAGLEGTLPTSR